MEEELESQIDIIVSIIANNKKNVKKQILISNILDDIILLNQKRKTSLKLLDEFLKSTFLDMFGDPINNSKQFNTKELDKLAKCWSKL